jgi:hypothetical protein
MYATRLIKGLLKFTACCVVLLIVGMIAVIGQLSYSMHKLGQYSQRMHVGMSVREFVKVMPTDYFYARVLRVRRDVPCRGSKGEFVPPESNDPPTAPTRNASEAEVAKLAPCPAVTYAHFKHNQEGMINLQVQSFEGGKLVTTDEFAEFIEKEFHDSRFYVGFSYLTGTPQHQTFGVWFDRNGRISEVVQPWGWD